MLNAPEFDSLAASIEYLLQILQTLAGDNLRAFFKVKDFHRHIVMVANLLQRRRYGFEIHAAESGAFQVFVVGMEMGKMRPRFANDLWNRLGLGAHGFHVENDFESRRIQLVGESNCLGCGINEIRLYRCKRLEANRYSALLRLLDRWFERLRCPIPGLRWRDFRDHVSLLR